MWNPPRTGIEPVSPALADGFPSTITAENSPLVFENEVLLEYNHDYILNTCLHSDILTVAAFTLQRQSQVVEKEILWPTKLTIFY